MEGSGAIRCDRSPLSPDGLVLQAPLRALLEGDNVTLRCRGSWKKNVTSVSFYHEGPELRGLPDGAELSLSPLQLKHSGSYRCRGRVDSWPGRWWRSAPVKVTVHELFSVPVLVLEGPPEITDGRVLGVPQGSPQLLLPAVGVSHSGNYSCEAQSQGGTVRKSSARLPVTSPGWDLHVPLTHSLCPPTSALCPLTPPWCDPIPDISHHTHPHCPYPPTPAANSSLCPRPCLCPRGKCHHHPLSCVPAVPVANATITPGPLAHQVHTGDNVTLRCSVQVGSAPVTFTWLHNGQEVARGPLLELRDIDVGQSGTYQCVATNQLGQDGHRVFRALSPELALEVTPGSPWVTVAAGVSGALLFLLLLVGAIVAWHRWHRVAARKNQERAPPDPPAPPEEGEVLYTHVVVTKRAEASPGATTLQDPQVTYAELRGHQGRLQEPGDIYGNVL
ncbi:Fc receptor-like protein 4 [Zonotrichia albicollis]|uniref:Fc receptor-like protein 4 n=1 Tax=Zonotrichia albicollis TaxID=44394 RepID=UPI003D80B639